jgi:hypothetical protein
MEAPTIASLDTGASQAATPTPALLPANATPASSWGSAASVDQATALLAAAPGVLTYPGAFSSFKQLVQVGGASVHLLPSRGATPGRWWLLDTTARQA